MKLLKFYTKTCSQCKLQTQFLKELEGVEIVDIDCEENEDLVDRYNVRALPTLVLLDDDDLVINIFKGVQTADSIKEYL